MTSETGIGATDELSLRVSLANLVRVLVESPDEAEPMLALERKATLFQEESRDLVSVVAQPFGGAIRIYDVEAFRHHIGDFHFDSEQSLAEQDFRIFIRPSDWGRLRGFCLEQFANRAAGILEPGPERELAEEFFETLDVRLRPDQYSCKASGTVLEDAPSPTGHHAVRGYPTVRIYRIFEARILDVTLSHALLRKSAAHSDEDLSQLARQNARQGGPGWANSVLTLPLARVHRFYLMLSPALLNTPVSWQDHTLDETVAAVLDEIMVEKYQRL